jgi:outer membrane protein
MKLISRHWCIAALALLMAAPAMAQEFRVGLVSLDRILREANGAKAAQAKLEQEFSRREKELGDVGTALKAASERFEREAPTLSEAQRAQRQKQLIDQDRDFQRKRRELQEDANARKNEELQQLIERSNRVIKQLAEQEKYDLVIQDAVYINPKHDITDKVIKALNASK